MASIQCLPFDFRGEAGWACLATQTQMNRAQIEKSIVRLSSATISVSRFLCEARCLN